MVTIFVADFGKGCPSMEQLKPYVGKEIDLANIKNSERLKDFGFVCRYLPDPPEDFDEFEFVTEIGELRNLGLIVTVQSMRIAKVFFGLIDPDNPDMIKGLTEEQLASLFATAESNILGFFDYITQ